MPKYRYRAVSKKGYPVRGMITAANEGDLFNRLQEANMSLLDCKEISDRAGKFAALTAKKIQIRDLIQMFLYLEQLQKAGVPVLESLSNVRYSTDSARLRDVVDDIYSEISAGNSFSNALAKHPGVFQSIFISLIKVGEETGNLAGAFNRVVGHLKWTDAMQSKIKKATRYPKILIVIVFGVIALMMGYVVPQIIDFLNSAGQKLSGLTTSLVVTSLFFKNYFFYMTGGVVLLAVLNRVGRVMSKDYLYYSDYLVLRIPVFGPIMQKILISNFCQTFSLLFSSGMNILKCLEIAGKTTTNVVMTHTFENIRDQVQAGTPVSAAINSSGEFPSLIVMMVKIGEDTGDLSGVLDQVVEFYDRDVNEAVDGMIAMIEPALTVVMGGIMLWIAAAVFGPVYDSFAKLAI